MRKSWTILAIGCAAEPIRAPGSVGDDDDTETELPIVDEDRDGSPADRDCDDRDPEVWPGAPDRCGDDRVTDCDRESDDGLVTITGGMTFTRLAEALDGAPAGSEVLVCPGVYQGSFWASSAVNLVSHGGRDVTVLDGNHLGTTLSVPNGSSVTGFTLTNGLQTYGPGGGLRLTNAGTLTVADSEIRSSRATVGGGLSLPLGSTAVISGTTITDNYADYGGGIFAVASTVDLTTSLVTANVAGRAGGGVALDGGALIGGGVTSNTSASVDFSAIGSFVGGGGVAALGTVVVTGTDIGQNVATVGAGVSVVWGGDLTLVDVPVHDNLAINGAIGGGAIVYDARLTLSGTSEIRANGAMWGGGVALTGGSLVGGRIAGNDATRWGGGVYVSDAVVNGTVVSGNTSTLGGGMFVYGPVELLDVVLDGNTADEGGGVNVFPAYTLSVVPLAIVGGVFTNNLADRGGAVSVTSGALTIDGVLFADNAASEGAALDLSASTATVAGSTVVRNVATGTGGGAVVGGSSLWSEGTDWGTGRDDNAPSDVFAGDQGYAGYGVASFVCDDAGCTPAP